MTPSRLIERFAKKGRRSVALLFAISLFGAAAAQAAVTVTRTSGSTFYTDTSITSPGTPRCGYVSFTVASSSVVNDAWTTIGSFSGGLFSLGGGDDGIYHIGPLLAGQSKPVFYYLCSSHTTLNSSASQSYRINVYDGNPSAGGRLVDSPAAFNTTINNSVIQANPNQVNVIVSGPNPVGLGGIITMTVDGDTGTTGCVTPPSACSGGSGTAGPLAFTPATFTNWRADAFEMVESNITFSGGNFGSYDNVLYIDTVPSSATSHYVATYRFRAMSSTGVTTTLSPVSYLASGSQMKHTTLSSGAYSVAGGLQPVDSPEASVVLQKTVSHATLPAHGEPPVTYTLSATNSGQGSVSLDSFVDVLPAGASYVSGSSTFNGAPLPDPGISGSTLTWSSLFNIPSSSTGKLVFQAKLPAVPGSYTNSATARIGSTVIDSTLSLTDDAPATATTTVLKAPAIGQTIVPNALAVNEIATMTLTISNPNDTEMRGIAVTDTLPTSPAGLSFTDAVTDCPGAVLAKSGSTSIAISGGTLPANGSCSVTGKLTSASVDTTYTNVTGPVSSTNCGTGGASSATVSFTALPTVTKSFSAASIPQNGTATMNITISSRAPISGVTLDDLFPAGMVTANPPSVTPAAPCGGTLSSWNGTSSGALRPGGGDAGIRLTGGSIATAGGSCSFSVNVSAATAGKYDNTTGGVRANEILLPAPGSNTASLQVLSPPAVAKAFAPSNIAKGRSSTLTITLSNANAGAITGVAFTDTFPAGVTSAALPKAGTNCPSGSVAFTSGSLSFTGSIPARDASGAPGSCTVYIDVTSDTVNAAPGYVNTIPAGSVTSGNAGSNSAAASATLIVNGTPSISKSFSFNPLNGTGTMTITITNNHSSGISGLSFTDLFPTGMKTASPPALSPSSPCGAGSVLQSFNGSSTAPLSPGGGDAGIALSAGEIAAAGGSCTFSINLAVNGLGVYQNQTSGVSVTAPFAGTGSPSNVATWIAPSVSKTLTPKIVGPGDVTQMVISITNPSPTTSLSRLSLSDSYPVTATKPDGSILNAAMTTYAANPNVGSSNCGAATLQATPTGISLSNGSLAPGAVCTFWVNVQATNTTPASYYNTTGRVGSDQGSGATGSDALTIVTKPTIGKSFIPSQATFSGATATSLLRIVVNNNADIGITNLSLSDNFPSLPSQMRWVNTVANSCGGTLTDAAGAALVSNVSTGIRLNNGAISQPNGSCTIDVTVSVSATGSYDNTTSGATSSASPSPGPPSPKATLTSNLPSPVVSKVFANGVFQVGGSNRLTVTISNPNAGAVTGVTFTDSYPAGLLNAAVPNLATTNCGTGAVATAAPGAATLTLTGATIAPATSCSISVDVTAAAIGSYTNTLLPGSVTATNANPAPQAAVSASSTAFLPPTVAKIFGTDMVPIGGSTLLSLTLANPVTNPAAVTGLRVDDIFPQGLVLKDTAFTFAPAECGTAANTAGAASASGDGSVRFSVATLPPGGSCQVTVNVTSPTISSITNTTNAPLASGPGALSGIGASASITFYGLPSLSLTKTVDKPTANPQQVVTYTVRITNIGLGPGTNIVLTDNLSPYSAFFIGEGAPFSFADSSPPSGLTPAAPQYSNDHGSTWGYMPQSGGGGASAGFDKSATNWRVPLSGSLRVGGSFTLQYRVLVQ